MTQDELFMQRALSLAALGIGCVSPNPKVGCVLVHDNKIIGEGWHQVFGGPHAEVNAIASVADKSLLPFSTAYVTLEPCAHTGKTPPCADLLIAHKINKVVVGIEDPNPLVSGKGILKLKQAGIEVVTGILTELAEELNVRFFTFIKKQRPYIILKWAQTADGFIAPLNRERKWISNEWSRQVVHKWRTEEDAVMIGSGTALYDNPILNARDWAGRNPLRIVVDRNLRLPADLNIFKGQQKTICYNLTINEDVKLVSLVKISDDNFLLDMLHDLETKGVQSVLVEGGSSLHHLFIDANIWDEARVFYSPIHFTEGIIAPRVIGTVISTERIMEDRLEIVRNTNTTH
jgi:diaminohydroxyphosphoribosylaminopyrimidine deaminase / 5-amino-6-(5-phosphoribosylamino)uracil reductase